MPIVVALLVVAGLAASEWLMRARVIPNGEFAWHLENFRSVRNENVVFGDSRTSFGIHGLPGFYNLSYAGDRVSVIELKSRLYFEDKRPGKIILQADPHMFSPNLELDPPSEISLFTGKLSWPRLWALRNPHRGNLFVYWKMFLRGTSFKSKSSLQQDGAITSTATLVELPAQKRTDLLDNWLAEDNKPVAAPADSRNGRSYRRVLELLTSRGADVCMVAMPMSQKLRDLTAALEPDFEPARAYFRSLAADFGAHYIDLSDVIDEDALFMDDHHLNEAGSRVFAPVLAEACFDSVIERLESGASLIEAKESGQGGP